MSPETAISIRNLSKEYYRAEKSSPFSRKSTKGTGFLAVNNISLDIKKGEIVCITGHNGSGKSTLLKMIAEVTQPTAGEIEIDGKVASILEIGIGFQPEISGYENIFLSGAMYGLKKSEIEKKIDKIIDMFGFPEFINTPVKYYSSGMYMRLAFSIIVNIEADIYLFDEVTSVGDTEFRTKVTREISRLKSNNATILVVTHTPALFSRISDKFIIFDKGRISVSKSIDTPNNIGKVNALPHFSEDQLANLKEIHDDTISFDITDICLKTSAIDHERIFDEKMEICATVNYDIDKSVLMLMTINDMLGNIIASSSIEIKTGSATSKKITFEIPSGYLKPSTISLGFEILNSEKKSLISYPNIISTPNDNKDKWSGYIDLPIRASEK